MSEAPTATRWRLVVLLLAPGVVCALQVGKVPMALPVIRAELDLSLTAAGWLLSMINTVGMLVGVAVGYLGDRLGHRRVILLSLWSLVAANLAGAASDGIGLLLVSQFVEGIGFIGASASLPSLLIRVSRPADMRIVCAEQRPDRVGWSPTGARIGGAISKSGGNASLAGVS